MQSLPSNPSQTAAPAHAGAQHHHEAAWPLVLLLAAAALASCFGILAAAVSGGGTQSLDDGILSLLHGGPLARPPIGPTWLREAARDVTALGSTTVLSLFALAALAYLLLAGQRLRAGLLAATAIGGQIASSLLKLGFHRPRPDLPSAPPVFTWSFPSGHALMSAVIYLTFAALVAQIHADRVLRIYPAALAVLLVSMIGISRIYLGVHYPSDVLGGWCFGAAWALAAWCLASWIENRPARSPREPSTN